MMMVIWSSPKLHSLCSSFHPTFKPATLVKSKEAVEYGPSLARPGEGMDKSLLQFEH
jgi:hypothetical protein